MKKVLLYITLILLALIFISVIGMVNSVIHVHLPHGAKMHILPALGLNRNNAAVILCPGGGYHHITLWDEGYMWFPFFFKRGYTVALLEYRMPGFDPQSPLTDGAEAIRMMRRHAEEWHFDAHNVGVMGFSAGGHLASSLMVTDNDTIRPNFGILFYPVISMKKELTHDGSHYRLLGDNAPRSLELKYSNELHVSRKTPPAFIAVSSDDKTVNPGNSIRFHDAMRVKRRPVTLHVYSSGGHGWGYRESFKHRSQMLDDLSEWLSYRKSHNNDNKDKKDVIYGRKGKKRVD